MTDDTDTQNTGAAAGADAGSRSPYRRPALIKLGSLTDMTRAVMAPGKADGQRGRRTGRGGLHLGLPRPA